jgi:hypothetical protein
MKNDNITNACTRQSLLSRFVLAHKPRQIGEAPNALAGEANVMWLEVTGKIGYTKYERHVICKKSRLNT